MLADDVLGRLVQQPGSLLGSLHAALQPIAVSFSSWSAASQALRELTKHKGLQKQLHTLHLGQLLLRYSGTMFSRTITLSDMTKSGKCIKHRNCLS